jgi:molybdopterin/thiamine biosynthesis adenylyltransferase
MFTKSLFRRVVGKTLVNPDKRFSVTDRQERVPGFNQKALKSASAVILGCCGLGSNVAYNLVRQGIGSIFLLDRDCVDGTNLTRAHFFKRDLGHNKAERLAINLSDHSTCGTVFEAYPMHFQDAVAIGVPFDVTAAFVLVDNRRTRNEASVYFRERHTPTIFAAVDLAAESGTVFVQEENRACFRCAFPNAKEDLQLPCRSPACLDILQVIAGLATYSFDSLIMDRRRSWNFRSVHLAGFVPSIEELIERNPHCDLCGSNSRNNA